MPRKCLSDGPRKPLKKVNVEREATRRKDYKKHLASPEYKAARAEAMKRSGGRCEASHVWDCEWRLITVLLPSDNHKSWDNQRVVRCDYGEGLQFHETDYGSDLGIIREIQGFMFCKNDHEYIEMTRHPTRKRR